MSNIDVVVGIVTTHKTIALVFQTQVYKLKRDMSKKNRPASGASGSFMQNEGSVANFHG